MPLPLTNYEFGPYRLDLDNRRIVHQGRPMRWRSRRRFDFLKVLLEAEGHVVTSDILATEVWRDRPDVQPHTINKSANDLKHLLGIYGDCIQNQPGIGFYFQPPAEKKILAPVPELDLDAMGLYGRALTEWNKRTLCSLQRALRDFREILKQNPKFVHALLGLVDCLTLLSHAGFPVLKAARTVRETMSAAKRALELAPDGETRAAALTALGKAELLFNLNFKKAEALYLQALDGHQEHAPAHHGLGHIYLITNRHEDALDALAQARKFAPSSPMIHATYGWLLYFMGRYKEAVRHCKSTASLYEHFPAGHSMLGLAYEADEKYPEAIAAFQTAQDLEPSPVPLAWLGHLYGRLSKGRALERVQKELEKMAAERMLQVSPYHLALIHAGKGEVQPTLNCLERAFRQRFDWMIYLAVDPRWQLLHSERRFVRLLENLGLRKFWEDARSS